MTFIFKIKSFSSQINFEKKTKKGRKIHKSLIWVDLGWYLSILCIFLGNYINKLVKLVRGLNDRRPNLKRKKKLRKLIILI